MTRINCIQPKELTRAHLFAEIREMPRVFTLARKNTTTYGNAAAWRNSKKPPVSYTLGTGHVNFHVDKLDYLTQRYASLCNEWRKRGYNVQQISEESLCQGIDKSFFNSYTPTQDAIAINKQRIADRLNGKGG